MTPESGKKFAYLFCFFVISVAVTGFFVGLQAPMNPVLQSQTSATGTGSAAADARFEPEHSSVAREGASHQSPTERRVIVATRYSEMGEQIRGLKTPTTSSSIALVSEFDPLAEVVVTSAQKFFALALREQNRAFNGAPPTIPHPIEQMSTQACVACHTDGAKTKSLRISKMSHQFLANCTQCHVEQAAQHLDAVLYRENSFVGMPAPTSGPRAFNGAPPQIPHSTWMRVDCSSCHGFTGQQGIRTTHPWRQNCQQCHAPSSVLDQVRLEAQPKFLPPPVVED